MIKTNRKPERRQMRRAARRPARRPAFVLLIVLVVVAMLSFAAYTFSEMMLTSYEGSLQGGDQLQAQMLVESGVDYTRQFLIQLPLERTDAGGLYHNPGLFQNITVVGDPTSAHQGSFTILSPAMDNGQLAGVRYGLEDESTRLNLNTLLWADSLQEGAGRSLLMALPGMDEYTADAILDWIDEDDEEREFGAEIEYYRQLDPPYAPKNGPLDTVEELLRVKGVYPQLLFGVDINRNGNIDAHETQGPIADQMGAQQLLAGVTGADGQTTPLQRGWSALITIYSAEANLNPQGLPRIDLNSDDLETLYDELTEAVTEQWATFIVAYRQNGAYTGNETGALAVAGGLDLTAEGETKINQLLDLIGVKVQANIDGEDTVLEPVFPSEPGAMAIYLPLLMDNCTVTPATTIPGRININQAPREILLGIPTITPEIVDEIIDTRFVSETETDDDNRRHETWLMIEAIVTLEEMKLLMPFICARGDVYRSQIVGYYQNGGVSARAEVVINATTESPEVIVWRDISHLGRGYPLSVLGVSYAAATE